MTIAGFAHVPGVITGWRWGIVIESLIAPIRIGDFFGIPIGIVQIVLVAGLAVYFGFTAIENAAMRVMKQVPVPVIAFIIIVMPGLVSSLISAIVAAILIAELVCFLPLQRAEMIKVTVIACFSIGLGAALTPVGEPLATITIEKLAGPPYYAGFGYLVETIGYLVLPGILALGILGMVMISRAGTVGISPRCRQYREPIRNVIVRALKVYVFIMALVLLGEGFNPLIMAILPHTPATVLYWFNIVSAILDNATLASAEISPVLTPLQIKSALMGLIAAGVMLIPGNIPNILASRKLKISSREWAKIAIPVGLVAMVIYFIAIFLPEYTRGLL
jgi:predicted cation transporter